MLNFGYFSLRVFPWVAGLLVALWILVLYVCEFVYGCYLCCLFALWQLTAGCLPMLHVYTVGFANCV